MINECRSPKIITKELLRVQGLIRKNKEFIKIYPEDYGLKLNLYSFEAREKELISEFQESLIHYQLDGFDILIKGKNISGNSITMISLGETLVKMQNLVTAIVFEQYAGNNTNEPIPITIKSAANINVVATVPGSFGVILTSFSPQQQIEDCRVGVALSIFNELLDSKDNKKMIKDQTIKLGIRVIKKYKELLKTIYTYDEDLVFYENVKPKDFTRREISCGEARKIYNILVKQEKESDETVQYSGMLKAIDLLSYKCRFQVDESITIGAKFNRKLTEKLKEVLDVHSIAKFIVTKTWNESTDEVGQDFELVELA